MNISDVSDGDLDCLFLDQSEEVKYRRPSSTFKTETGERTDKEPDKKLDAIVSSVSLMRTGGSGGSALRGQMFFVFFGPDAEPLNMRWRPLPEEPATTHRIVRGTFVYEVVEFAVSACGRLREVQAKRLS